MAKIEIKIKYEKQLLCLLILHLVHSLWEPFAFYSRHKIHFQTLVCRRLVIKYCTKIETGDYSCVLPSQVAKASLILWGILNSILSKSISPMKIF